MGCDSSQMAIGVFREMMEAMDLKNPVAGDREEELKVLSTSVNPVRLINNPILLSTEVIKELYKKIVKR